MGDIDEVIAKAKKLVDDVASRKESAAKGKVGARRLMGCPWLATLFEEPSRV